jgi:glycosyltransferase involved in cell wall biosynthesis
LEFIDVHLIIAGEFYDDPSEYYSLLDELNIDSHVTIVNQYIPDEEVGWYFQLADLVVLPYVSATHSGVIPLAYHFLKPVIATSVGGLPDVVFPGKTGYLVPPKEPEAIVAGIQEFLKDRENTDFQKEIRNVLPMFSWKHLRRTILNLIKF